MNIGVVTYSDEAVRCYAEVTIAQKREYCARHGYSFYSYTEILDPSRSPTWNKIPALLKSFSNHDWLLWTDADTLIAQPWRRLEPFVDVAASYHVVMPDDETGINAGNWFVRNSDWARSFLAQIYDYQDRVGPCAANDQPAMRQLIKTVPSVSNGVRHAGQAFVGYHFQPVEFMVHLSCWPAEARRMAFMAALKHLATYHCLDSFDWLALR